MSMYQRLLLFVIGSTILSIAGDDLRQHTINFHSKLTERRLNNHHNTQNTRRAQAEQNYRDQKSAEEAAERAKKAEIEALKQAQLTSQQPADKAPNPLDIIAQRLNNLTKQ